MKSFASKYMILKFQLPVEVHQLILLKSAAILYKTSSSADVYTVLTSVCCDWYDVITRWRWFRCQLKRFLSRNPLLHLTLPFEVWEMILIRCYVKLYRVLWLEMALPDFNSFTALTLVCWQWQMALAQPRIRRLCRRYLASYSLPYHLYPQKVATLLTDDTSLSGVTQLHNRIFMVFSNSYKLTVFDCDHSYGQQKDIPLKGMKSLSDIVACADTKVLYLADRDSSVVWRLKGDGGHIERWVPRCHGDDDDDDSPAGDGMSAVVDDDDQASVGPVTLSQRSIGRLLVVNERQIFVYGPDGNQLRQLTLPEHLHVRHAVETHRDTFIVCHTGRGDDTLNDQIIEVDGEGRLLRFYGSGVRGKELNQPCYLSLDPMLGHTHSGTLSISSSSDSADIDGDSQRNSTVNSAFGLFVADLGNERILLLNENLQLERVLVDNIRAHRLYYVRHTGQLLIGTENGHVIVLQLRTS